LETGQGAGEAVTLGPELGEVLAPGGDGLLRRDLPGVHPVGLLPHLAEALHWSGEPAPGDVGAADSVPRADLEPVHLPGPAGRIPRARRRGFTVAQPDLLGRGDLLRTCRVCHRSYLTTPLSADSSLS